MESKLRILHIEDNPFDAELIHNKIENELSGSEITLIKNKVDLNEALENGIYDIVICDYRIPGFNTGAEALEIIRVKIPDIPVLFISGTIGEILAVELLKKGATDYILKDSLVKLIPSIKRAVAEYKVNKEKVAVQKALEESEERYRKLFANVPIGIYRSTPEGQIILANPFLLNVLGYESFEELRKRNKEKGDYLEENERKKFNEMMKKNDEVIGFETIWKKNNGLILYVLENSRAVRGDDGEILYYEGTIEDISEKKQTFDALKQSETQLNLAQEMASMGNWELDLFWQKIIWSHGMYKIYGIDDKTELKPDILFENIHPQDKERVVYIITEEIKEKKEEISFYYRIIRPDGETRSLFCILRIELLKEIVKKIFGTVQDVTEQKKTEKEINEAREKAEESDKLKTEFLAQISHEIRTPLNTLFNLSHLVNVELENEETENLQSMFDNIDSTGRRLLRTLELMLNMATVNTNSYSVEFKEINLKELIQGILKKYNKNINEKRLKAVIEYERKNELFKTDEYLLQQILENIIDNAVKFTNEGGIKIKVSERNKKIKIDIEDSGIGIAEKYIPNLFKPFTQESTGYSRKYDGNGLGLTLTKRFVEILDGNIEVISEKDNGSTFSTEFDIK